MNGRTGPATAVVATVLAALVLAACGGGSSTTTNAAPKPAADAGTTTASKPQRFRDSLVSDRGFTEAQATCIEKGVLKKIGRAQFDQFYGSGNVPQRVQTVIFHMAAKCAPRGPGQ